MEIDFDRGEGAELRSDVCIVGAGAAGIALALSLRGSGLRVLLVESGGRDLSPEADQLSAGEVEGFPFTGLSEGRARAFGGATRLWAGQCIRLDPIDYQSRGWVPNSGWPIGPAELDPFYDEAERLFALSEPVYDARIWRRFGLTPPAFDPAKLQPKFTVYCREPDFKKAHHRALCAAPDVALLLGATVTRLNPDPSGRRVVSAEVSSLSGRSGSLRSGAFVLCGGGVENARLLLASNDVVAPGLGNDRDLVGRYFQDHPNGRVAVLHPFHTRSFQEQFGRLHRKGETFWPKLAISAEQQTDQGVLNGNAYPEYDYPETGGVGELKALLSAVKARRLDAAAARSALGALNAAPAALRESVRLAGQGRAPIFPPARCWIRAHVEQAPDRDNRISLSDRRDRFGVPLPKVTWRVGELERRTLRAVTGLVRDELERLGLARVEISPWLEEGGDLSGRVNDAYHHAGTTRMGRSPADSVVDTDCRVHAVANLYLAGGSVFPTSGYANPTLTIVALALRLGRRLRETARDRAGPS